MDNMIDPLFNALVGEEKWAEFKQAGRDLWNGFTQGVQEFFDDPGAWIKQHIVDPGSSKNCSVFTLRLR